MPSSALQNIFKSQDPVSPAQLDEGASWLDRSLSALKLINGDPLSDVKLARTKKTLPYLDRGGDC
jgi:hypothetical protein